MVALSSLDASILGSLSSFLVPAQLAAFEQTSNEARLMLQQINAWGEGGPMAKQVFEVAIRPSFDNLTSPSPYYRVAFLSFKIAFFEGMFPNAGLKEGLNMLTDAGSSVINGRNKTLSIIGKAAQAIVDRLSGFEGRRVGLSSIEGEFYDDGGSDHDDDDELFGEDDGDDEGDDDTIEADEGDDQLAQGGSDNVVDHEGDASPRDGQHTDNSFGGIQDAEGTEHEAIEEFEGVHGDEEPSHLEGYQSRHCFETTDSAMERTPHSNMQGRSIDELLAKVNGHAVVHQLSCAATSSEICKILGTSPDLSLCQQMIDDARCSVTPGWANDALILVQLPQEMLAEMDMKLPHQHIIRLSNNVDKIRKAMNGSARKKRPKPFLSESCIIKKRRCVGPMLYGQRSISDEKKS